MKLNLGCNTAHKKGFVNVDICPPADVICDLSKAPWPWEDSSVELIIAQDIIEHLPNKILTMNELWRVLAPQGRVHIGVPTTNGPGAFQDPTHVSYWNRNSFKYYEFGNIYRDRFAKHYGIRAQFIIVASKLHNGCDGEKLDIILEAVK